MNGIELVESEVRLSDAYVGEPTTVYQTCESPEHGTVFYDTTNASLGQAIESGEWISSWETVDPAKVR
jgi:hypothetical protein